MLDSGKISLRFSARPDTPYTYYMMTIRRSPASGLLAMDIESFAPGGSDPVRIEMGRAVAMAPKLLSRYGISLESLLEVLAARGHSMRLISELAGEFVQAEKFAGEVETC